MSTSPITSVTCDMSRSPVTSGTCHMSTSPVTTMTCHMSTSPVIRVTCHTSDSGKSDLSSSSSDLASTVPSVTSLTTDTSAEMNVGTRADKVTVVQVKQEPTSPVTSIMCHMSTRPVSTSMTCHMSTSPVTRMTCHTSDSGECDLSSSSSDRASTVPSLTSLTTDASAEMNVGTSSDEAEVKCHNAAAAAAAAAAADVNVMSLSSVANVNDALQSPVSTETVSSPISSSHSLSPSVVRNRPVSLPQQLVRCRDSLGKTYYIPRSLLQVQTSSAVSCTTSRTEHSLSSTYCLGSALHSTSTAPVTVSGSRTLAGKSHVLPSVGDVDAVLTSKSDGLITTSRNVCTVRLQPDVAAASLSRSVINNTTLHYTVATAALTTVTVPSSAKCTSTLSCSSHTSVSDGRQVRHICPRDQLRMGGMPYTVLNNVVIKPRPLVPLCSVNSPARSLPHITVLSSVSSLSGQNTAPAGSVMRTQRPTCHVSTKLTGSNNSPMYVVVGGNNKVVSVNSRGMMEVVLVPATKDTTRKVACSVQSVRTPAMNGRCISSSSQRDVAVSCLPSSPQSTVCLPSLNRISKPVQMSRSSSQISALRPLNVGLSTVTTKSTSAQLKRTSASSSSNVFATKIGNQTVIVDMGNLSSSSWTAVKPLVTAVTCTSSMKPKDTLISKSASTQRDTATVCRNVLSQSSAPCVDRPSTVAADEVAENCAAVIRYFSCFLFFFYLKDEYTVIP